MIQADKNPFVNFQFFNHFKSSLKLQLFGISFILAFVALFLTSLLLPLTILLVAVVLYINSGEKFVVFFFPIIFLTLINDIAPDYRTLLVATLASVLLMLFAKNYQFKIGSYPKLPADIVIIFGSFIFVMICSTIASNQVKIGLEQILRVFAFLVIFYLLISLIINEQLLHLLMFALISSGAILSISILYEFSANGFNIFIQNDAIFRLGGIFSNVNFVSVPIYISAILCITYFLISASGKRKKLFLFLSMLTILALILNNSRSSLVAFLIASSILFYFQNRRIFFLVTGITLFTLLLLVLNTDLLRLVEMYFRLERLGSGRENWWSMAYEMFLENPIVGVGPASFKYEMYKFLPVQLGTWDEQVIKKLTSITDYGTQHNFLLFLASDMGLAGLLCGGVLITKIFTAGLNSVKKANLKIEGNISLNHALFAILIGFLGRAMFESINIFSYGWLSGDLPFWLIFFALLKLNSFHEAKNTELRKT